MPDVRHFIDQEVEGVTITSEHITEKIIPALEAFDDLCDQYDLVYWECEQFIQVSEDEGGTLDVIAGSEDGKTVAFTDLKTGEGIMVDPKENPQEAAIAVWLRKSGLLREYWEKAEKIVFAIIQPNTRGEPALKTWETDWKWLDAFEAEFDGAVEQTLKATKDEPLNPGPHCREYFCPANAFCPKTQAVMKSVMDVDPQQISDIEDLLDACKIAEDKISAIRTLAHNMFDEGYEGERWKLVNKRPTRQWTDEAAAEAVVKRSRKLKREETHTEKLLSPAQMQKLYKSKNLGFEKLDALIASISSGTTLAPMSDKRPAVIGRGAFKRLTGATK